MLAETQTRNGGLHVPDRHAPLTMDQLATIIQTHGLQCAKGRYETQMPQDDDPWKKWRVLIIGAVAARVYNQAEPAIAAIAQRQTHPLSLDLPVTDHFFSNVAYLWLEASNVITTAFDQDMEDAWKLPITHPIRALYSEANLLYQNMPGGFSDKFKQSTLTEFEEAIKVLHGVGSKLYANEEKNPIKRAVIDGFRESFNPMILSQTAVHQDDACAHGVAVDDPFEEAMYRTESIDILDNKLVFLPEFHPFVFVGTHRITSSAKVGCPARLPYITTGKITGEQSNNPNNVIRDLYSQLTDLAIAA